MLDLKSADAGAGLDTTHRRDKPIAVSGQEHGTAKVRGIDRVASDYTSKPPGTIEWEWGADKDR